MSAMLCKAGTCRFPECGYGCIGRPTHGYDFADPELPGSSRRVNWTWELFCKRALRQKTRGDLRKNDTAAYAAGINRGWLDKFYGIGRPYRCRHTLTAKASMKSKGE